jgi:hypothetical protein
MVPIAYDNGGRRFGFERRQFSYFLYIPERRSGLDRRIGIDRRSEIGVELSGKKERRAIFKVGLSESKKIRSVRNHNNLICLGK